MITMMIGAIAIAAAGVLISGGIANADTQKCRTGSMPGGTYTYCDIYTDDGGWYHTTTYCDNTGRCSTENH
jgi:hypothetical protein